MTLDAAPFSLSSGTGRGAEGAASTPKPSSVMAQARAENFPVASRLLPRRVRRHLLAVYGFARLVDDAGDEAAGDRLALLDELEADLRRVWTGSPRHPLMVRLQPTVRECSLPVDPFRKLIEAGRRDQLVWRYDTFEDLLGYCELSANSVGEIVLHIFDCASPDRVALSDKVCTGLQLVEHWQDVAEDRARGRIYLPARDRERFGVTEADLDAAQAGTALRALLQFEVGRARRLLDEGAALVRAMRGRPAWAVATFVAGGQTALAAIERSDFDVLGTRPATGGGRRALRRLGSTVRVRWR